MAKPKKDDDRRARIEAMRREARRAERRRTMTVVVICAAVAIAIVVATAVYLLRQDDTSATASSFVDGGPLGGSASSAGCDNIMLSGAEGAGDHRAPGTQVDYAFAPPAFGPHYDTPATFATKFYTADDRPPVEAIVHNLEHGYTILWYDSTIADDPQALEQVQAIARPFEGQQDLTAKFIAAPWTSDDGAAFPDGKHVALTHWSADGEAASDQGQGDWLYCADPSAEVVTDFMTRFPYSDSLEPNGG